MNCCLHLFPTVHLHLWCCQSPSTIPSAQTAPPTCLSPLWDQKNGNNKSKHVIVHVWPQWRWRCVTVPVSYHESWLEGPRFKPLQRPFDRSETSVTLLSNKRLEAVKITALFWQIATKCCLCDCQNILNHRQTILASDWAICDHFYRNSFLKNSWHLADRMGGAPESSQPLQIKEFGATVHSLHPKDRCCPLMTFPCAAAAAGIIFGFKCSSSDVWSSMVSRSNKSMTASPVLVVWRYPGMLATQESAREGRDDGAKMAARVRVLPLWGQEIFKGRISSRRETAIPGI